MIPKIKILFILYESYFLYDEKSKINVEYFQLKLLMVICLFLTHTLYGRVLFLEKGLVVNVLKSGFFGPFLINKTEFFLS